MHICIYLKTALGFGGRTEILDQWVREVVRLTEALRARDIDVLAWQDGIERFSRSVPLQELSAYLDGARAETFAYSSSLAEAADPVLPRKVAGEPACQNELK